jgi:NAD(P)-dependent dehydrogenase (short-subunit alcohol dehydrogenase family)
VSGICEGRVVIVTGAGRGIGRGHALELGRQGARVVVNDLGAAVDGDGSSQSPAEEVVEEIRAAGGEAVANADDVSDWAGAEAMVQTAIDAYGRLDVLVNNAGILRDRTMVNMAEDEWDSVIKVHLKGTFASSHFAANHWRERSKAGETVDARIINTTSASGLYGAPGQSNYGAAKAGIAAFTVIIAKELERYGVRANAVSPGGRTRMTEALGYGSNVKEGSFDFADPENVAPLVVWLASPEAADVTGQVFEAHGGIIGVEHGWRHGPRVKQAARWDPAELGPVVRGLLQPEGPTEAAG